MNCRINCVKNGNIIVPMNVHAAMIQKRVCQAVDHADGKKMKKRLTRCREAKT